MGSKIRHYAVTILGKCFWLWTLVLQGIKQSLRLPTPSVLSQDNGLCGQQTTQISLQTTYLFPSGQSPQKEQECQSHVGYLDKTQRLPSIYSGIGLGVYQGEIVTFRLMAVGERRWVVSRLRYEDLNQLPHSILSEVCLELCLLRLYHTQPDLVKNGLQTKGGIELMKSHCPSADSLDMLLSSEAVKDNHVFGDKLKQEKQYRQICSICQRCPYNAQCNIDNNGGQ